jgi:ATP-binding cassette, subfamily G (WHITE), member 2, SNQ2
MNRVYVTVDSIYSWCVVGCSTFLKAIANQRGQYAAVSGDVKYAGISSNEMSKLFGGEVVYNQEGK